jgi:hypothetical protein
MGTYGRSFRLSSSGNNKPGDSAAGGAAAGPVLNFFSTHIISVFK